MSADTATVRLILVIAAFAVDCNSAISHEPVDEAAVTPELFMSLSANAVTLSGQVTSESHAEVLTQLVQQHFRDHEINATLYPAAIADVDWQVLTLAAVFVLAETDAAHLLLRPRLLKLDGISKPQSDLLATRLSRLESAGGSGFESRVALHQLDTRFSPDSACTKMFRSLNTEGVLFVFGTAQLRTSAHATLDRYIELAGDCPDLRFRVDGHTDSSGSESLNLELSEQRARAVANYLVQGGVASERVKAVGKGPAEPVADNATPWGRRQNRRIEIALMR